MPRTDQVIAYAGLDVEIKESGLWKGQAKLSKRGSGLLRQTLYLAALRSIHLEGSAFGAYYRRLVERGLKKGSALMAVMRKMLAVTVYLLKHEQQDYDRSPGWSGYAGCLYSQHTHSNPGSMGHPAHPWPAQR